MRTLLLLSLFHISFTQVNLESADLLHQFNFPILQESSSSNPAQVSPDTKIKTGYREQFGLAELSVTSIGFSWNNLGVEAHTLSFNLYRMQRYTTWISLSIFQKLRAGFALSYKNQWIKNYGESSNFSPTVALLYQTDAFVLNIMAKDIVPSRLFINEYQLNSQWTDDLIAFAYFLKYSDKHIDQVLAFAVQMSEYVQPAVAYHLSREALAFSIKLAISKYELRYSLEHHPELGESFGISLAMRL